MGYPRATTPLRGFGDGCKEKMEEKICKNFHFVAIFICGFFVQFFLQTNRRPLPHYEAQLFVFGGTPLRAFNAIAKNDSKYKLAKNF